MTTTSFSQKVKQFLIIFLPIFTTQIALSAMSFFDTNMSGKFSPADLAGVAIGTSLWLPVQTGLSGILIGITPVVSHLLGSKRNDKIGHSVVQGLYLGVAVGFVVLAAGALLLKPILNGMPLEPRVGQVAFYFLCALAFGVIPLFGYTVLRSFMDALGQTRITMMITLVSLPVNILLNYLLIFGRWGFPQLGGVGAGVATASTYWLIFLISLFFVHRIEPFAQYGIFRQMPKVSLPKWKELLKIGVPIGFATFFETSIFAAVTLLMSRFDTITIAAHQAALNFASTLYMLPVSICMALTILVGYEAGAGRVRDAKQYSLLGIGGAIALSLLTAVVLIVFGEQIAGVYSNDRKVIALTQHFLIYAIFFQISDAIATPTQGALRGYKDVNPALIITFVAYWIIGLPVGYITATYTSLGAFGYWVGLIAGLAVGATALLWRLFLVQKQASVHMAENK
ncbi:MULTISPECIES: MATE family efflux transporter [unclassified Paenibacillus]|uniref:MATE family efflux transporter n=1 Tax=unclassified Paenibacillus TaxID=185978 RepID=UPI0004A60B8A|nr:MULTISPECIES: MATE family efflux transporter [unclassified Paenibacillus]KGP84463.1 multidrug transporter MatE [Paenibacillus sp. MAEPY2]KGP87452.1 multidrug transporter MatE [Paenibacillus sp. MAEPY1]